MLYLLTPLVSQYNLACVGVVGVHQSGLGPRGGLRTNTLSSLKKIDDDLLISLNDTDVEISDNRSSE